MPTFAVISLLVMIAWAVESLLCALQVRRFSREINRPRREKHEEYHPPAAVIAPFKGADDDLPAAIESLCTQVYPEYRLLLVVDSQDDPAFAVLTEQAKRYPHRRIDILVSGAASADEGQKIHNQLFAIEHLTDADVIWAFADSDAVPGTDWLAQMVAPLMKPTTGMTTGYRWLIPQEGAKASLPSKLASIVNSSVACGYRSGRISQAWGGAMALRAQTAKQGDLTGYLRGALTDDYQFTRMCRDFGKRVYFVPRALAPTPIDFDWPGFLNFAHRQYLITRIYAPRLFVAGLTILSFWTIGCLTTWAALAHGLLGRPIADGWWIVPAIILLSTFVLNQVRSYYRRRVVEQAFGSQMLATLHPTLRLDRFATTMWMLLHWLLMLRALAGGTMTWRGLRYRLDGPQKITRLEGGSRV